MSQKLIIGFVAIVILGAGLIVYSSQKEGSFMDQEKDKQIMEKDKMVDKVDTIVKDDKAMMQKAGSYEIYDSSKMSMASATHKVVLFFKAVWCPTCKAVDADIKSHLKEIPENLTILEVDYDKSAELKKKYSVTYQHTFVQVDSQGNLIKKWSGSPTLQALLSEVK